MSGKMSNYRSAVLALSYFITASACMTETAFTPVQTRPPAEWVESCADWDDWGKPGPPFRIFGNSYYVGTCGITAILVTGDEGHVLIDGGTEAGADRIAANIEALGFSLGNVKLLLHSHEHFDHVAGLARLQQLSGARLLASPEAAPVLRSGIAADVDPQAGMHEAFPAARVDAIVREGETVKLGKLAFTPIATPGHTPGALSWQWQSCEEDRCLFVVYADSLSPVSSDSYRFSDHLTYVDAYRAGLHKLAVLDCAILLTPHPSASNMRGRLSAPEGLVDREGCKAFAEAVSTRLDTRISNEQADQTP
jgi:metallo-beta-lactamase class B